MRKIILKISAPFIQYFAKNYFSKSRRYRYKNIKGMVLPGVFFPHFTISTKLLLEFLEPIDLNQKSFLELGCGAGFISVLAAQKGANVLALDINPRAIENTSLNAKLNRQEIEFLHSDLFERVPKQDFDFIIINPPYYPKNPKNNEEEAWYCGEDFEYFKKLFAQLPGYFNAESMVYMILSEDCELLKIQEIAMEHKIFFEQVLQKKKWGEKNYIFRLKSI